MTSLNNAFPLWNEFRKIPLQFAFNPLEEASAAYIAENFTLPSSIFNLLDDESKANYTKGCKQIVTNIRTYDDNFIDAVLPFFFVFERELTYSCSIWMRGELNIDIVRYPDKYHPSRNARFPGANKNSLVEFNQKSDDNDEWEAPTMGKACMAIKAYVLTRHKRPFEKADAQFFELWSTFAQTYNHLRHFQHGPVTLDEIVNMKKHLDIFLLLYLPDMHKLKMSFRTPTPQALTTAKGSALPEAAD